MQWSLASGLFLNLIVQAATFVCCRVVAGDVVVRYHFEQANERIYVCGFFLAISTLVLVSFGARLPNMMALSLFNVHAMSFVYV